MKRLYKSVLLALLLVGSFQTFAQVPIYNSNTASGVPVIFLDFDGHTVQGTSWNVNGPIFCGPSGLANDQITEIFNRIAEDYSPFTINVTTDSTKYWAASSTKRMRVIFTVTSSWYGNNAGGVAYTGSFSWGDNTPCFIFSALLGYSTKKCAEAGAHEAGHTFGLRHQASYDASCNLVSAYNYGYGDGETSWAPIMGVGYSRNLTTWHNGPNPYGCNNLQNDMQIITSNAGVSFKADEFGDTFNGATSTSFVGTKAKTGGNINTDSDKDMVKFTLTSAKKVNINALPTSVGAGDAGSNLNLEMVLYNGSKQALNKYNPTSELSASVDTTLGAGTYYIQLDGVENPYASDYGSVGSYSVLIEEAPLTTLPVHSLNLRGTAENGYHKLNWVVDADEKLVNQVVEISTNGKDFTTLSSTEIASRSFSYHSETAGVIFYRVKVTFDNIQTYYTNIIAMRSSGTEGRPKLFSTVINSNSLMVSSPSSYQYAINDINGRVVSKGQIPAGSSSIQTNYLSQGTYMIRFANGNDQYVEKFLKQ
jgi:hypothetical protein